MNEVPDRLTSCCRRSGSSLALLLVAGRQQRDEQPRDRHRRPALADADVGGQQAVRPRAVRQARRAGSGHPAFTAAVAGAGRQGLRDRAAGRHAARVPARHVQDLQPDVRPDHPGAAAGLAAGVAAAGVPDLHRGAAVVPELDVAGVGGAVHHRHLRDVADGAEHRRRRARDPAGLPQRRQGAAALARRRRSSRSCCPRRCRTCSPASA